MGKALSLDDVDTLNALARAIAREVVRELANLSKPPVIEAEPQGSVFEIGPLVVDVSRHEAVLNGEVLDLTPREFALLAALARNAGKALSRDLLLELAWPSDTMLEIDTNRTVDVHVRRLRRALGDDHRLVQTIHGIGYRLRDR